MWWQKNFKMVLLLEPTSAKHRMQRAKNDFIHKLKIAAKKQMKQPLLLICQQSKNYPNYEKEIEKLTEITKILSKIIVLQKPIV